MNKEISVRRRIASIFNKREEDFPTLKEYNDYLESVEETIFNLVEGVNVPAIEARIAEYQEQNAEQIAASKARKAVEQAAALRAQEPSKGEEEALAILDAAPAQLAAKGGTSQYAPAMPMGGGMFMQPRPAGGAAGSQPVPVMQERPGGNGMPEDDEARKLRQRKAARAGGWLPELARRRAYEEAFACLWVN